MNGIDIERARREAATGSMVAKVALAVAHGQASNWPAAFRDTAASLYAEQDPDAAAVGAIADRSETNDSDA